MAAYDSNAFDSVNAYDVNAFDFGGAAPPATTGGGVLLDLGKRRRPTPKGLSHVGVNVAAVGGERLNAAGTRERANSLRELLEQKQRLADDELAFIFILTEIE